LFQIQGEKGKAFQNFEMALKIANELESNTRLGDVNQNLGSLYFKSEQYAKAIEHLKQALKYAEKTNSITEYYEIFNNLSSALEMSGSYKEALQYRNLYIQYKDSIYNVENSFIIQEMKEKYEALEKEELIARQKIEISEKEKKVIENEYSIKQKEQQITLITGFAVLIIISLVLYVQQYRRVQKNARLQLGFELEKLALEFSLLQEKIQRQIPAEESNASLHELDSGKKSTESDYTLPESAVDSNDTPEVIKINKYLHDPLSMREFEILNLISTGKTNREIAELTFISENTVKYHLKNIYVKLDVKNRTEALRKASQIQAA
jgi:DNA-binding CsgD family transcriptional regulator